jgi:catechol 2,3-dioxygenase-like lactoylglutathione lyase family enzyme
MSTATASITGVDFVCVPTEDFERASRFYGETLGLPYVKRWGDRPAAEYQAGNLTIAVMEPAAFGQEFRRNGGPLAFQTDDVEAMRDTLQAAGVTFVTDVFDSGVCLQAVFLDPDGNPLILHRRYAEAAPGPEAELPEPL